MAAKRGPALSRAELEALAPEAIDEARHLDMRMRALRGLAQFRDEKALMSPLAANDDAMHEAFEGRVTIGEDGMPIALRSTEESKRLLTELWTAQSAP